MGEYFQPLTMVDDSDNAVLAWQNSPVLNITAEIESDLEPPYETDSEDCKKICLILIYLILKLPKVIV
jgi:hypothetical protein